MRTPLELLSRQASRTNRVTMLVLSALLLFLGFCGIVYWRYVEEQTLHLQERNFRSLTVTSQALAGLVANYEKVFESIIRGNPCQKPDDCHEDERLQGYQDALSELQGFKDVTVTKADYEEEGITVKLIRENGASYMKLKYVQRDHTLEKTKWKIGVSIDIGTVMRPLVTEEIFSDVLLADLTGRVLYHQPSRGDHSGFEFDNVSPLLRRLNGAGQNVGDVGTAGTKEADESAVTLPLFNDTRIGEIPYSIFAQGAVLPAQKGTSQTLLLVGLVPAGQFHAEARAIPLNYFLLLVVIVLCLFFTLPYIKLRTNWPAQRLTAGSVTVLIISTILGTALLTFGLASVTTYQHMEQHLDERLEAVSHDIRKGVGGNIERGLRQLKIFDQWCSEAVDCRSKLYTDTKSHLAQRLCLGMNETVLEKQWFFFPDSSGECADQNARRHGIEVDYLPHNSMPAVNSMLWVGRNGELKILWSRDPYPWKSLNLKEREYVSRIWESETFSGAVDKEEVKFWVQPIFSWTTGKNYAVLSMESKSNHYPGIRKVNAQDRIVAALEVKLPSVTDVGVPPGLGFAVIDQGGQVLFHSDPRRNLRENFFEETDSNVRLRQAVYSRSTSDLTGRYWGKDRHFQIAPLFSQVRESPDVHWSLVTYWDTDILRWLNLRILYIGGALFAIYIIVVVTVWALGQWTFPRWKEGASRLVWPQARYLRRYEMAFWLLVLSLGAVGLWYVWPHPHPALLVWGLAPIVGAAVLLIARVTNDSADGEAEISAPQSYRHAYALVVTAGLLVGVVMPALVCFRVAADVEWRLLAKFSQFDLIRDYAFQAQEARTFARHTPVHEDQENGHARTEFAGLLSSPNYVYADFPFQTCWMDDNREPSLSSAAPKECNGHSTLINMGQHWDEHLIRWLYYTIGVPHSGRSGVDVNIFLEEYGKWQEPEQGTLSIEYYPPSSGTLTRLSSQIPAPVPPWLYSVVVFGSLVPLVALLKKKSLLCPIVVVCALTALGMFWLLGLLEEPFVLLAACVLLYGVCHVLPEFAARRVLLLDFPHPTVGASAMKELQEMIEKPKDRRTPPSWPKNLSMIFLCELSSLCNVRLIEVHMSKDFIKDCLLVREQETKEDFDIEKERIIQKTLEAATPHYEQIWKKCTESQRCSLFNLARDGFLHSRNPDIEPLLKSGLIVADLNLRPMNESFRRFIIRTGLKEHLEEDLAQEKTGAWFQVWRPIGGSLLLVMVFLVLTQEQYRAITLAFLGVLPGLLGAFSQTLTAPKKEKPEPASAA